MDIRDATAVNVKRTLDNLQWTGFSNRAGNKIYATTWLDVIQRNASALRGVNLTLRNRIVNIIMRNKTNQRSSR